MTTADTIHCYCSTQTKETSMLQCVKCKRYFHMNCLRTGKPSPLEGDIFFQLVCEVCCADGENVIRQQIPWLQVVILALYNLPLSSSGKNGFFRWKEHICTFIDKHWLTFFGSSRKKTHTWHGTVAGTLSQGCPLYFTSGTNTLKASGWWKLSEHKPPALDTLSQQKPNKRYRIDKEQLPLKIGGLRSRRNKTSIQSAIELRAKRDTLQEAKEIRSGKKCSKTSPMQAPPPPPPPPPPPTTLVPLTQKALEAFSHCSGQSRGEADELYSPETSVSEPPSSSRLGNQSFEFASDLTDQSSQMSFSSTRSDIWLTDRDLMAGNHLPILLMKEDAQEDDDDLEIDPCAISPPPTPVHDEQSLSITDTLPNMEDIMSHISEPVPVTATSQKQDLSFGSLLTKIKSEPVFETSCSGNSVQSTDMDFSSTCVKVEGNVLDEHDKGTDPVSDNEQPSTFFTQDVNTSSMDMTTEIKSESKIENTCSSDDDMQSEGIVDNSQSQEAPLNEVRSHWKQQHLTSEEKFPGKNLLPFTVYEEKQLLKKLKSYGSMLESHHILCRLKRKLIVQQQKYERGLPVFDLDAVVNQLTGSKRDLYGMDEIKHEQENLDQSNMPMYRMQRGNACILDRYHNPAAEVQQQQQVAFITRLIGTEDDQLQPVHSPYTSRLLKPFIRRDYETEPPKLKLLKEIQGYPYRSSSEKPVVRQAPIDYCYVRPQHIPSINTLCRQFFWPGIDVSGCLQYPDFSCVALYRKLVIGFAFMVPDVKYNEAYISFIFTHPEWRGSGIACFMLYHLIQTCRGKDVTLHVSASNPAMLLYQKFGFKQEEFILDFYDKYFPAEAKDSRHAFFLRLRR